jgi:hypothetical protein
MRYFGSNVVSIIFTDHSLCMGAAVAPRPPSSDDPKSVLANLGNRIPRTGFVTDIRRKAEGWQLHYRDAISTVCRSQLPLTICYNSQHKLEPTVRD